MTDSRTMVDAIFANQATWLARLATGTPLPPTAADQHPTLWHDPWLAAARTGRSGVILTPDANTEVPTASLDATLDWLARHGTQDVLIWSPTPNPMMHPRLLARGAIDSFEPHWMWRDLTTVPPPPTLSSRFTIHEATLDDLPEILAHRGIPYVDDQQLRAMLSVAAASTRGEVTILIAREHSVLRRPRVIGLAAVNLIATFEGIVGGLFNLGVHPSARGRGVGTALTAAILAIAREHGAIGLGLNATPDGERIYVKLGFRPIGRGQTWLLPAARLRYRPDPEIVLQVEALARDDRAALSPTIARIGLLPNGEMPVVFAARFGHRELVRWLVTHGAQADIVAFWKVGLRDEAIALMHEERYVNRIAGPQATTPLHDAIALGDATLARHLIASGADLDARDSQHHGTPLDWARALQRDDIADLLR